MEGLAVAVMDGSYAYGISTASWTIQGHTAEIQWTGPLVIPGLQQDPYHVELSVILDITINIDHYKLTHGRIKVGCENITSVSKSGDFLANTTPAEAHFDIIEEIRQRVRSSPVTWYFQLSFHHVYIHQDGTDAWRYFGPFDRWATLNIQMDSAIKAHLQLEQGQCAADPTSVVQSVSNNQWELWVGNQKQPNG